MKSACAAWLLAAMGVACEPKAERDAPGRGPQIPARAGEPLNAGPPGGGPFQPGRDRVPLVPRPETAEPSGRDAPSVSSGTEAARSATSPAHDARDLSAELAALVGDPDACAGAQDRRADGPPLDVVLEATVSRTGIVTRAEVSGGLSDEARACLRRRLLQGRLRTPVDGAPRTVRAVMRLERRPAPSRAPSSTTAPY
ncbi:MAG: hypothetical protein NZ898_09255 [Myxococcota bacterium]|nr:hypothetical protein [Myxococcota bacterium]MDW8361636.1 hypothetical protein [Myxococcales bacterium]